MYSPFFHKVLNIITRTNTLQELRFEVKNPQNRSSGRRLFLRRELYFNANDICLGFVFFWCVPSPL